jgi:hypothetical protein
MGNYRELIARRLPARPWKGTLGERFSGLVGGLLADIIALGAATAVQALWLIAGQPSDVLGYQGSDRRLRRYLAEDDEGYRERLGRALEIWESSGTADCLLGELGAAGYESAAVYSPREWDRTPLNHITQIWAFLPFASHADGSSFFLCGGGALCGASGVVAGDGTPFDPPRLAGSTPAIAGQHTAGITAAPEVIDELRYIMKTFKAGHEVCRQIIVEIDGPICGTNLFCGTVPNGGSGALCGGTVGLIGTGVIEA